MNFRNEIENRLLPLFESKKCAILDAPSYSNAGDQLIWAGMESFFANNGIECVYRCSTITYEYQEFSSDTIICLVGGGNFGDLWRGLQEIKNQIVASYPNNRIIIFPQSVFYGDMSLCEQDSAIFAQHKDLYICARDKESYAFLQKHFKNQILLVPDMALYLSYEQRQTNVQPKTLFMMRADKEAIKYDGVIKEGMDVRDWPTHNPISGDHVAAFTKQNVWSHRLMKLGLRLKLSSSMLKTLYKMVACNLLQSIRNNDVPVKDRWEKTQMEINYLAYLNHKYTGALNEIINTMLYENYMPMTLEYAVEFMNRYDEVYSTRLHGGILAMLLGKKVHMIDNSYGKLSALYNTWLTKESNVDMVQ